VANDPTDTKPVWSAVEWEYGACAACDPLFSGQDPDAVIQVTHCGGTGCICIIKETGQSCSTGTAPDLGDFGEAIKAFIFWGAGGFALSANGNKIIGRGTAVAPDTGPDTYGPLNGPPWDDLFVVSVNEIGLSSDVVRNGQIVGHRAVIYRVNSIAEHTCCD